MDIYVEKKNFCTSPTLLAIRGIIDQNLLSKERLESRNGLRRAFDDDRNLSVCYPHAYNIKH